MKNIDITLLGCVLKYDIRGVKKALLKGANPNAQFPDSGLAALHIGAAVNNAVCVPILIAAGADPALRDKGCNTAADLAGTQHNLGWLTVLDAAQKQPRISPFWRTIYCVTRTWQSCIGRSPYDR